MIAINNINSESFEIDNRIYSKIYNPIEGKNGAISIVNIYDSKQLIAVGKFSDFIIDGEIFDTAKEAVTRLLLVTYNTDASTNSGQVLTNREISTQLNALNGFVNALNEEFETSFINQPLTVFLGAINRLGNSVNDADYIRTTVSNVSTFYRYSDSDTIAYTGEITNTLYVGVAYFDSNGLFLGHELDRVGVYQRAILNPPSGTTFIAACSKSITPVLEVKEVNLRQPAEAAADEVDSVVVTTTEGEQAKISIAEMAELVSGAELGLNLSDTDVLFFENGDFFDSRITLFGSGNTFSQLHYYRKDGIVFLGGAIEVPEGYNGELFTLPTGFTPNKAVFLYCGSGNTLLRISVTSSGRFLTNGSVPSTFISFTSQSFAIDN